MAFYPINLVVLIALNVGFVWWKEQQNANLASPKPTTNDEVEKLEKTPSWEQTATLKRFRNRFLVVYLFVVAADWLQGSFIYTLYKVTHNLSEGTVAALFTTGFFVGAISATFVGGLADKYGRKKACLAYCFIYSLSCLSVLVSDVRVLFLGRALGGISTTLLYSVFEAWMVTEVRSFVLENVDGALSHIFGAMATMNGVVAILCGIVSEALVRYTGSTAAPFMASIVCLFAASQFIVRYWNENYGDAGIKNENLAQDATSDIMNIVKNVKITTLGLTSCFFEGSMYVLVYFWSQAIITARKAAGIETAAPFGIIFASFMCALMLGSLTFRHITQAGNVVQESSFAIQMVLCISASTLSIAVLSQREIIRFWAFCLFEFCIGIYLPSMGSLKGSLINDGQRGKIYGLMRLPLNTFVVMILSTIGEGDVYRDNRFMLCGGLMLACSWLMKKHIN